MTEVRMLNPETMGKPLGQYSHIARVKCSELAFIAGQVSADKAGNLVGANDFQAQCAQTFANLETALKSLGAGWGNVVQLTTYLVHSQDIAGLREFRAREFQKYFPDGQYPPNTLLIIDRLVHTRALSLPAWRGLGLVFAGLWLSVALTGRAIGLL